MEKWKNSPAYRALCNYIFPLILLLYPLRHIHWGLDLWDTGYNYANFRYMGLEHMDPMWFFSTYLANVAGHALTLLPGGERLLFMNLYTGLFVSLLSIAAYLFCTGRIGMPAPLVFLGEIGAVSLCWCPTALLYNYLTYVLFLAAVLLLYEGLAHERELFLVLAGVALGTNIFVRFSNLPQAAMIVAVWAYAVICRKKPAMVLKETGLCMAGYLGAAGAWLAFLSLRYGFAEYAEGIRRLFAMTDSATDYKATSMLYGIYLGYRKNLHWFLVPAAFALAGSILCTLLPKRWKKTRWAAGTAAAVCAAAWLYSSGEFCSLHFDEYDAMRIPAIVFLMLTLLTGGIRILQPKTDQKEKLLAGMIMLVILLTPIGSNNVLFPAINNLFLAIPYMLWTVCRLCAGGEWSGRLNIFALKTVTAMYLGVFLFQSIGFGTGFVFVEAAGAKNIDTKVENNVILKGIYMSKERAEWMSSISAYVTEQGLSGKEVILYGQIPALSFYLEMPSAFNPWSDLRSYSAEAMEAALEKLEREIAQGEESPVVIINTAYAPYMEGGEAADEKFGLLLGFMDKYGYRETFSNSKFMLYERKEGL